MKKLFTFLAVLTFILPGLKAQMSPVVVADGFTLSPIGVNLDAQGNLWVGEMGTGNDDGQITIVDAQGNKDLFMSGLPSGFNPFNGELAGPYRAYQLPDDKVLIMVGEGEHILAEALLTVDKNDYSPGNPLTLSDVEGAALIGDYIHAQGFVQSNPYNLTWDAEGHMYIADSGANSIVKRDKNTGDLSIVATLDPFPNPLPFGPPMVDPVPTKVLAKPDGTFYICQLTGFPFIEGASKIYNMDATGNLSVHDSLFTCITDMAFDPTDGNLCVLQFGVFGPVDTTLNFILGTAAVIKLMPDGSKDTIATGIGGLAPSFTFDAEGNVYVTDLVFGQVLKYQLTTSSKELPVSNSSIDVFPNPFSTEVKIEYQLSQKSNVALEIFDLNGQKLVHKTEKNLGQGIHHFIWNGRSNKNGQSPNGMYFYRLRAGDQLLSGMIQLYR